MCEKLSKPTDMFQKNKDLTQNNHRVNFTKPYIEIIEQPTSKSVQFPYECEGRLAGRIPVVQSTSKRQTYPTIRIVGYKGPKDITVIVSCVTKSKPYLVHPYNLIGKDCKHGVCSVSLSSNSTTISFPNLGIQCVEKGDIEGSLKLRQMKQIDPFGNKFDHMYHPNGIDLSGVRLCFQAFVETSPREHTMLCRAVSSVISNETIGSKLVIKRLSHLSCSANGNTEIILLCEKITKGENSTESLLAEDDIKVSFYKEIKGLPRWEAFGEIVMIHNEFSIVLKTPAYTGPKVGNVVWVNIQLKRVSDGASSEPYLFFYNLELDEQASSITSSASVPLTSCSTTHTAQYQQKDETMDQDADPTDIDCTIASIEKIIDTTDLIVP